MTERSETIQNGPSVFCDNCGQEACCSTPKVSRARPKKLPSQKCKCGFFMPAPAHGFDCPHYAAWLKQYAGGA